MPTGASTVPGIIAVGIRRPDDVLRLVRLFLGNQITSEEHQGATTYLAFTRSYTDSQTGEERKRFYYAAVTPRMLLFGQRKTVVSEAASRLAAAAAAPAAAGTLAADPQFLRLRASLPPSLTSLSYSDLTRLLWQKFAEAFVEGFRKSIQKSSAEPSGPAAAPAIDPKVLATVLARYLHLFCYASWKDGNGLFVESGIE
jgi:hypothetical protein